MVDLKMEGARELDEKLGRLATKTGKKIVRKATREAMKPVLTEIKNNARNIVGGDMGRLLAKHLILRALRKQRRGSYGVNVKFRSDVPEFIHKAKTSKYAGGITFIPAAIEYGHDNAAPIPFMRKAVAAKQRAAESIMRSELKSGIETEAKKN